jgi:hypothetical protein
MVQLMGGQANLGEHLLEGWIAAEGGEFRVNAKREQVASDYTHWLE